MNQSRNNQSRRPRRDGFTLVELLVAMAVTLILIFALAQAFAIVGETVSEGRAAIEMAGTLRGVAHRLQDDLSGITVAVRPWADDASGQGYFELLDGLSTDKDPDGDNTVEIREDRNSNSTADWKEGPSVESLTEFGDIDDVLAFTARSDDTTPYVGELNGQIIESTHAEIVWWIQLVEDDGNNWPDPGDYYAVYRRVLLIRPDLANNTLFSTISGSYTYRDDLGLLKGRLENLLLNNDISVNIRAYKTTVDSNGNPTSNNGTDAVVVRVKPNSLADLIRRENRFAHYPVLVDGPEIHAKVARHPPDSPRTTACYDHYHEPQIAANHQAHPFQLDRSASSVTSLNRMRKKYPNEGEDVMLTNVLCFDLQVFDPGAPIRRDSNTGEALLPSDPTYFPTSWPSGWSSSTGPNDTIGYGAFVDLGYGSRWNSNAQDWSSFSGNSFSSVWKRTYCTWSTHYERDGWDQDGGGKGTDGEWGHATLDHDNDPATPAIDWDDDGNGITNDLTERGWPGTDDRVDSGTNGFDDNGTDGVDDPGERETSPPYSVPLRGIQVKIRVWDPDSRQVRQMTVVSDFVPE